MTEDQNLVPEPDEAYAAQRRRLWNDAVATLTAAARLSDLEDEVGDFPGFLASALGAVAANLGGLCPLMAGRPGSWEADLLAQLLDAAVGYAAGPLELASRRTLPVLVPLNVAELVAQAYGHASNKQREERLPDFKQAAYNIFDEFAEWSAAHQIPDQNATAADWEAYEGAVRAQSRREQDAADALRERYRSAYQSYAGAFTAAVLEEAKAIDGLSVAVEVRAEIDPEATWWNPREVRNPDDDDQGDALAWHLWHAARARVGDPTLDAIATSE